MGMAYLFWFILGGLGAHRFYLGFPTSGAIQAATWFGSWLLIATGFFPAIVTLLGGGVWVLVDAFLIPGLHARANARTREAAVAYAFG